MDFLVISKNEKFYEYPQHSHEYWEILLNIEGDGIAYIENKEYAFKAGTIFCIRPGTLHGKKAKDGFVDGAFMLSDCCFEAEKENVLLFQDDERNSFYSLFKLAYEYPLNPATDMYGERFLRSIIEAAQNLLCHWKDDTYKDADVLRVQKCLAEHIQDTDFDIDELIATTPYSPNYFRKIFREQCGSAPLQYYTQLKIQHAKSEILQHKSIRTITEIAKECGFEDPYYFSRVFKKNTGLSPLQYYKKSRETISVPSE